MTGKVMTVLRILVQANALILCIFCTLRCFPQDVMINQIGLCLAAYIVYNLLKDD